ncbi:MAG: hypothetical protein IIC56_04805 [Proteobacteria bacterium]|nr:hypothetical protein [Pseudomonadota bacterium]
MNRFFRKLSLFILPVAALGLAACETPVKIQKLPELTYGHLPPLKLNVAKIEVVVQYQPPLKEPNVEHLFPTPPLKALRRWAADRLRAVGRSGKARLFITDARAIETPLQKKTGVVATFTKQQSYRYDLTVETVLEVSDARRRGRVSTRVTRFTTLSEDVTINERDQAWFDLTEALIKDFDAEFEKNIRQALADWVR